MKLFFQHSTGNPPLENRAPLPSVESLFNLGILFLTHVMSRAHRTTFCTAQGLGVAATSGMTPKAFP